MSEGAVERAIRLIRGNPWHAHITLFAHRHKDAPADFHPELVADFWSDERDTQRLAYRGSAKSTLAEEDAAIAICCASFRNILIIGASETRAAERLAAIAYELETNELLEQLFGPQKQEGGANWTQTRIVTRRQVCVQAMGRDQSIRGIKFHDQRPDFVLVDDFEDKENVQTPEARIKTLRWFLAELLPACDPDRRVRIRATPMDAESVPMRLWKEANWPTRVYPIEHPGEAGERVPSWPSRHPLGWIDNERRIYERLGEIAVWQREYMCEAIADADTQFRQEQIKVRPQVRTWQASYAMIDPARSVGRNSASTGWAVWSWLQHPSRLVVWGADAQLLLPDEIVALAFEMSDRFDPVHVGVEQDGLEQFLLQPLRQEMVRQGRVVPVKGMRAPRGKLDFIRGLQPFFAAGEVEFAQELPALKEQLLNFPRGRIDAPNALAYALLMRPGLPIYENFSQEHIVEEPLYDRSKPLFLSANASGSLLCAALVQAGDGGLRVIADFVAEGVAAETVPLVLAQASLLADASRQHRLPQSRSFSEMLKAAAPDEYVEVRRPLTWVIPPVHGEKWVNVGLRQAIRALPAEVRLGGGRVQGQQALRDLLDQRHRGMPAVEIGRQAHWTLRALAGGYTRAMVRGRLQDYAEEGPYRLLMEGLESFAALLKSPALANDGEEDDKANYAFNRHGQRYESVMPQRGRR